MVGGGVTLTKKNTRGRRFAIPAFDQWKKRIDEENKQRKRRVKCENKTTTKKLRFPFRLAMALLQVSPLFPSLSLSLYASKQACLSTQLGDTQTLAKHGVEQNGKEWLGCFSARGARM